ncbi:MAG: ABC transporter substrate-binding protein [Actinomycetota bacterium]|nr:ABC transporter substrate-binding protein [Actinomycetota bacterium]
MSKASRDWRRRSAPMVAAVCLVIAGCGNRLPHEEIVTAAAGGTGSQTTTGAGSLGGSTTGAGAGTGTTGLGGIGGTTGGTTGSTTGGTTGSTTGGTTGGTTGSTTGGTTSTSGTSGTGTSSGSTGSATKSVILLGNVGGYSGPVGASTASAQTMLRIWEAYTNDHGGLNGHPVKIFTADDQSDPSKSQALVRDMVENKHVVAFVGNQMALTASAPRKYLEQKQVPAVGGDLTSVWHQSPMYFAQGSSLHTVVLGLAKAAVGAGKQHLGVLYCAEAGACKEIDDMLFAQGGAKSQGIDPAYHAQISLAQPDFTSECISARNAGVDALSVVADVGTTNRVAASCARQNYHPTFVNTGNTVNGDQETNKNLVGMITTQNWFAWALNNGAGKIYQDAMKRYAPGLSSTAATASVWASGQLLAKALQSVGPGPVTSDVVLQGLWRLKNETLDGLSMPLTFAKGKPTQAAPCYFEQKIINRKWTVVGGGKPICLR